MIFWDDIDLEDFISEADLARSEGFDIDDDGHWVPRDDDNDDFTGLFDPDDEMPFDQDEFISEADFARGEGFYLDDDGHWIPDD